MKVKATRTGFYDNELRKEGDKFEITGQEAFSKEWMEKVSKPGPKPRSVVAPTETPEV